MGQQGGEGGRGGQGPQRGGRKDDQQQQQDERRAAGGNQEGQAGKQAGPVLPAGEKVSEWSEEDQDEGLGAGSSGDESGEGGYSAPSQPGSSRQADSEAAPTRPDVGSRRSGPGSEHGSKK